MAWQPLFRLTVQHAFFTATLGPNFDFVPTPPCEQVINNAQLLLRADDRNLALWYDTKKIDLLRSFLSTEKNIFSFDVYAQDACFTYYTDLTDQYLSCSDCRRNAPASDDLIVVKLAFADTFHQFSLKKRRLPVFTVLINLSEQCLAAACLEYVINFAARQTYWKYYLLGSFADQELRIVDLQGKVQFKSAGVQMPFSGTSAAVFYSTEPIALQDRPDNRFQLRQQNLGGEKVLIKRLKNAAAEHFHQEIIDGKQIDLSEIFINY